MSLKIGLGPSGELTIRGGVLEFRGRVSAPGISPCPSEGLRFVPCGSRRGRIGGMTGEIVSDRSEQGGVVIGREAFQSDDQAVVAVRVSLENRGEAPLYLDFLEPIHAQGDGAVSVAGAACADWSVVRMARQKNDIPGCYRPGEFDANYRDAVTDSSALQAGMGATVNAVDEQATCVNSEPCIIMRSRKDPSAPAAFLGVLGQQEHLSEIRLATTADRRHLAELSVICEFDHCLVGPGQRRRTHWVVFWQGADEHEMLCRYGEMISAEYDVARPGPAPSIFCSWYFYGWDFTQADLEENLAELRRRPIPFDVFIIDNGWEDGWGSCRACERFPDGMAHPAEIIRQAGYQPGIWTAPFVIDQDAPALEKYPDMLALDSQGKPCTFPCFKGDVFIVDPTSLSARRYYADLYGQLASWGFTHHKLDFLRALIVPADLHFHDRSATRAQAYRRGLELIRQAVGKEAYILACGGLFEGTVGLADGNRTGSDVKSRWHEPDRAVPGYLARIKQNLFRNYTNRYWHSDPDALQLRRRAGAFRGRDELDYLAIGWLTDDEAFSIVVSQYLAGGAVCFCERLKELDDDRLALLRHVIPAVTPPAKWLDADHPLCPSMSLTRVTPRAESLGPWWTLAVSNWEDEPVTRCVPLPIPAQGTSLAVFEFATQHFMGVYSADESVELEIPAHGTRLLRIVEWNGRSPVLLGTDQHLSGGAAEFERFEITPQEVRGVICSRWRVPIMVTVGLPGTGGIRPQRIRLPAEAGEFSVGLS